LLWRLVLRAPRDLLEVGDDPGHALRLAHHDADRVAVLGAAIIHQEQLREVQYRLKRVVQLVRDAADHGAEAGEAFGATELLLALDLRRRILCDAEEQTR